MNKKMLCAIIVCLFLFANLSWAQDKVSIFTEEFPPFQYSESGHIKGISTQIVQMVMKKANVGFEIKTYPWSRSMLYVKDRKNALIFSISRLPAREKMFKWVGIIAPAKYSIFSLKTRTDIQLNNLEDAKQYTIGTTINDARESYLISHGFRMENFDRVAGKNPNIQNYKKLKRGRIDLWPMPDAVAFHIVKEMGDQPETMIEKKIMLEELSTGGYYLAANIDFSDELFKKIQTALINFKQTQAYLNTFQEWGLTVD